MNQHTKCGAPTQRGHPCQKPLGSCPHHDDKDRAGEYIPPERVECPCGAGMAERTRVPTHDPDDRHGRPVRHYHYRHGPCQLGGTIVTVGDEVRRRYGPVFQPERYGGVTRAESVGD